MEKQNHGLVDVVDVVDVRFVRIKSSDNVLKIYHQFLLNIHRGFLSRVSPFK